MKRIKGMNMKINEEKSVFGVKEVTFLGHVVSVHGIKPTQDKIQAILDLQPPSCMTELKSLMGTVNFVGKFIPNLASITAGMRELLVKDTPFVWRDRHDHELNEIKSTLGKVESLGFFNPVDETLLITDASPVGVGAILAQVKDGVSRAIYCASKSLSLHEKKYCQTEKECYAIVWAMEKFYMYLYGHRFTLITDCKPLQYLFNRAQSKPSARIERWILRLQSFDFDVRYEPGDKNLADSFSRLSVKSVSSDEQTGIENDVVQWLVEEMKPVAIRIEDLSKATTEDEELCKVKDAIETGDWSGVSLQYGVSTIKNDLIMYGDLILRGDRIVVPSSLREKVVQMAHSGHQGSTGIKALLRSKVWFPGMDKLVEQVVKRCKPCQMTSIPDSPNPIIRRIPTQPWQDLAMDFKEGLPSGKSLLVVVCYTSRFIQVEAMRPATSQRVISALLRMFSLFGVPRSITADNGPQFRSSELKQFCTSYGIHLNLSTPYWPEQNGAVERQMRNIGRRIKISTIQGTDWENDLLTYLLMYHATPQETTGVSPSKMMLGRELQTTVPSINKCNSLELEQMRDRDMILKEKHKTRADERRHVAYHKLREGDTVIIRNIQMGSLQPTFTAEEFKIIEVQGSKITVRSKESGRTYVRNSAHLKKLQTEEGDRAGVDREEQEKSEDEMVMGEDVSIGNEEVVKSDRARRMVQKPERFKGFVMGRP